MGLITNYNNIRGKIKILLKKEGRRFFKNNHFSKTDVLAISGLYQKISKLSEMRVPADTSAHKIKFIKY
jgi:hypothetical protein